MSPDTHEAYDTYEVRVYSSGRLEWRFGGVVHREDGPAVTNSVSEEWWCYGELHREDGPAIEYDNGSKEWYQHGKRHRIGGPAIVNADGSKTWALNGICMPLESDYKQALLAYLTEEKNRLDKWQTAPEANEPDAPAVDRPENPSVQEPKPSCELGQDLVQIKIDGKTYRLVPVD